MVERISIFICKLCDKPVALQDCVTDDMGDPVHQTCYNKQSGEREKLHKVNVPSNWLSSG